MNEKREELEGIIETGFASTRQVAQRQLREEIFRIVSEAKVKGEIVKAGSQATILRQKFPEAGFSRGRIINEIAAIVATAGVKVDLSRAE